MTTPERRWCGQGKHHPYDDGKGKVLTTGGSKRWICAACIARAKAGKGVTRNPKILELEQRRAAA